MTDFITKYDHEQRLANSLMALLSFIIMLIFVAFFTSCMSDDYTEPQASQSDTYINLSVSAPTSSTRVKANAASNGSTLNDNETSASPETEDDIHSIKVWAFKSGTDNNATPIGYRAETGLNANGTHQVSMKILKQHAVNLKDIDLYILLNGESVNAFEGFNNLLVTRKDLKQAVIQNRFGIENGKAQVTQVPASGLPISRAITNINVEENVKSTQAEAASHPINIPLIRAVSKLHFFFARKDKSGTDEVEISKIEVDENVIPTQSYVFPEATTDADKATQGLTGTFTDATPYESSKLSFEGLSNDKITCIEDPQNYIRKDDEPAQTYMERLRAVVKENHICYLRETNKSIKGKIYYRLSNGGEEKTADFEMPVSYRNHEVVVYGYFLNGNQIGNLQLSYYVAEWNEKGATDITFN